MEDTPVTIWQPTSGNGDMSIGSEIDIDTLSGLGIVTKSGLQLVTKDSVFTQIPSTVWIEDQDL